MKLGVVVWEVSLRFEAQFEVDNPILRFANEPLSSFPSLRPIKRYFAYWSDFVEIL